MKLYHSLIVLLFLLGNTNLYGQKAIVSAGGKATNTSGSSSFTVGEIVYEEVNSSGGKSSSGVQLPFEIYVITSIGNLSNAVSAIVFPNPSTDRIILKMDEPLTNKYSYVLYNSNGMMLSSNKVTVSSTEIPLTGYSKGIYILEVQSRGLKVKSFKIVKAK
jgi:hypothetical protein